MAEKQVGDSTPAESTVGVLNRALMWVWRDGVLRYSRQTVGIAITSTLGVAFQAAALSWVYAYATHMKEETPAQDAGLLESMLSGPAGGPLIASLMVFVLLGASGLTDYYAFRGSLQLRRFYSESIVQRVLLLASRLPGPGTESANAALEDGSWIALKRRGAKACGHSLAIVVRQVTPVVRGLSACGVMAYINLRLTAVVALVSVTALFALRNMFRAATAHARQAELLADHAAQERKRLSRRVEASSMPLTISDRALDRMFSEGAAASYHDVFFRRYLITGQSRLATMGLATVLLIAMVVAAGGVARSPEWNWPAFFMYLVALRIAVGDLTRIAQSIGRITRFAEYVNRVATFIDDASAAPTVVPPSPSDPVELNLSSLVSDTGLLRLLPGERYLLLASGGPGRHLVSALHSCLPANRRAGLADFWHLGDVDLLGTSLRAGLGLPDDLVSAHLSERHAVLLEEAGRKFESIPDLDETLNAENLATLEQESWLALKLLAAEHSQRTVVLVSRPELEQFSELFARGLARITSTRALIVVEKEIPREERLMEGLGVLVARGSQLVGWCAPDDILRSPSLHRRIDEILSELPTMQAGEDDLDPQDL